jgi:2-(1,2-epoxy-1,2-dihydrophenyl)acetyl-CoA isomerase
MPKPASDARFAGSWVPLKDLLLAHLAGGPTRAYANAKRLLNRTLYPDFAGQLDAEARAQREQGQSADFIEGVLAFAEKRPPRFTGA